MWVFYLSTSTFRISISCYSQKYWKFTDFLGSFDSIHSFSIPLNSLQNLVYAYLSKIILISPFFESKSIILPFENGMKKVGINLQRRLPIIAWIKIKGWNGDLCMNQSYSFFFWSKIAAQPKILVQTSGAAENFGPK